MPPDPVMALARKWTAYCVAHSHGVNRAGMCIECCAAAVRAALKEAEKIITIHCLEKAIDKAWGEGEAGRSGVRNLAVAAHTAAIAALRGETG